MTIEIKNAGPTDVAILTGDQVDPTVKVLKSGETFHSAAFPLAVVDDNHPGLKDRRAKDQPFAGRRKADPNVDMRQVKKAKAPAPEKAPELLAAQGPQSPSKASSK